MAGFLTTARIDVPSWTIISPVSISFWFRATTVTNPERLVGAADEWEVRVTQDWTPGSDRLANELFASTLTQPPAYSTTVIQPNTLYFVVATATQNVSSALYLNGILESTGTCIDNPVGTSFSIGGSYWAPLSAGLNGSIDDVRVYNRVLSADEVSTIYACKGVDNIYTGLVNRWLMGEGAENVVMSGSDSVKDLISSKNGTPTGSPTYDGTFLKTKTMTKWQ